MIEQLLDTLDLHNVSDIFLTENKVPHLRINAEITPYQDAIVPAESVSSFRNKVLSEQVRKNYEKNGSADTAYLNGKKQRFRLNFYESME
jgi:Tfp pilus assembly pilus retraction ATPase PilT